MPIFRIWTGGVLRSICSVETANTEQEGHIFNTSLNLHLKYIYMSEGTYNREENLSVALQMSALKPYIWNGEGT